MASQQVLLAKHWFIIHALTAGTFTLNKGVYKLFNKSFKDKHEINLNTGDSYIMYTESEVLCEFNELAIEIESILHNPLPSSWLTLKIDIRPVLKNRIFLLGANDSGKTTLIKFLALNLPKSADKVGLIDVDVGQNSLGLPGTINLSEFTNKGIVLKLTKYFGHVSPAGNANVFLQLVNRFNQKVQLFNYSWLFIDTSGYIQTSEAIEIKKGLLAIFKPQIVLLVGETASELQQKLLTRYITYMSLSSAIKGIKKEKNPELRRRKRNERFHEYFKDSILKECSFDKIEEIQVNYDDNANFLDSREAVKYFLEENISKLEKLFIAIETLTDDKIIYAVIDSIMNETIQLVVPNTCILPDRFKISIGSIYLDFI